MRPLLHSPRSLCRWQRRRSATLLQALACSLLLWGAEPARSAPAAPAAAWAEGLRRDIERIDRDSDGTLGVYVKRLDNGEVFNYGADGFWYLGSTVKVPVAIAVLQRVDAGRLALSDRLAVLETDKVDGSGPLVWQQKGVAYSVDTLIHRMLRESDNTAANLLMRTVGLDELNRSATAALGRDGFDRITSMTQIRHDVYAEIHPRAAALTNLQLVQIAAAPLGPPRVEAVRRTLQLKASELQAKTIDEAYARYYAKRLNSATLVAYGGMLEKLVRGRLLTPRSKQVLFDHMSYASMGDYRLQGGLPKTIRFIHKTGTQYRRACHMGVINPQDDGRSAIVIATCAAGIDEQHDAGVVFERIGRAISQALLTPR